MAVIYMKKLEEEPSSYENEFTKLTKGVNIKIHDWVLERIQPDQDILEIGCGPGVLSFKLAKNGNQVIAIDQNPKMIKTAKHQLAKEKHLKLSFKVGNVLDQSFKDNLIENEVEKTKKFNVIISTFMLTELRPFEQQIFLRNIWNKLEQNGKIYLAAEFEPKGIWKIIFKLKRLFYMRKLEIRSRGMPHPMIWFQKYIEPIGYKINSQKSWQHGAIRILELTKQDIGFEKGPGYYYPPKRTFRGLNSWIRKMRCLLTGQIDHVPIEPGIYKMGNPDSDSPIIVTANYDYTYIQLMRKIDNLDLWILSLDSRGINVWCAARGNNFGNPQLIEAVNATEIRDLTTKKVLILPQLSAGGIAIPQLPKKSPEFPFKIKYGPIWAKYIPEYLRDQPSKKPDYMKHIDFSLSHRMRAGFTHSTFLLRKIFLIPIFILSIILLGTNGVNKIWIIADFMVAIIVSNFLIAIEFPISKFTRRFIFKGLLNGLINTIILGVVTYLLHQSL
ncbi:MAG: methyltransferase domain-containing protein, partial [archaeon]|nr:methyltransferase domain-containing protein [archaeon]